MTSLIVCLLSPRRGIHVEEELRILLVFVDSPCIRVNTSFNSITEVNNSKFCPTPYSRDFLSFDSLSRDWILKLDPNDNFRN